MDKHYWPGGLHHFIAQQHGPLLYGPLDKETGDPLHPTVILSGSYGALVNAEILRLAQRESDLQAAINTLEEQLFATQQERDAHKTALAQAEHRESLWQSSAERVGERARSLENDLRATREHRAEIRLRLDASESRERQYCAELAEKADELRRVARRERALESAIEDGIAHVEAGRMALLYSNCPISEHQVAVNALDLAHKALSKAASSLADGLRERVARLEQDLGKLGSSTSPAGQPPTRERLASLEARTDGLHLRVSDLHRRVSAIEQGPGGPLTPSQPGG